MADPPSAAHAILDVMLPGTPSRSRRRFFSALGSFALAGLSARRLPAADHTLKPVAHQLFVREGLDQDADATNDDAIANLACIVGEEAAAVIDPGGSLADGLRFKAAIRRVTRLPIRHVVITHAHPDHLFGAQAFADEGAEFVAHAAFPTALANRGDYYRDRLSRLLGHPPGDIVVPKRLVGDRDELDLGHRRLELRAHPPAHSSGDLTVLDVRSNTLLAGDLLFVRRIPSLDGSLKGWLSALAELKALPAQRAVPGHGPAVVQWPSGASDLERYLRVLQSDTRRAISQGVEIDAAVKTVGQSERGRWSLFDAYNGHNATRAYKEIEWD
jgi:quinoprotein relay system zinc metallohydrolase 2